MGDRSLTYEDLNRFSNRIGRSILRVRGTESEPIALLIDIGIDVIAGVFGTLKTGKFYVALDPSNPAKRNAYILDDSQASLILTDQKHLALAHKLATNGQSVLNIDEIENGLSSDNLGIFVASENCMSIGYTSGSSGTPKGVVKIHGHTPSNYFSLPVRPDDKLSLIHSVSFGQADACLFSSLLNGASLFPFDIKSEGILRWANWLAAEKITICDLTPAAFRELAEVLATREMPLRLRTIRLAGSPITRRDFELYREHFSKRTVISISMGATETGISFSATVDHAFDFPQEGTPIGYPFPGKKVFLLNDAGVEVEEGQMGEIVITGRIHAGYWRKPDLTREKFLPDPSGGDESVYLTGDLGRKLPDGFFLHMGRKDSMVKIRGYRVEIGEVEGALLAHPKVRQVGVVAWNREKGEQHMVAYLVSRHSLQPTVSELHDFLRAKLPEYMIPSSYVFLESLPLTNGKLDRSQLPLPENKRPDLGRPYTLPRNAVEQSLVQIWEKILDVRSIGIYDDFFELGGHSLLASRLFIDIEKAFAKQLPVTTLFWARNVEQLARIILLEEWSAPWSLMFPIQTSGSKPPFFWVYGETSDVLLPHYLGTDQPLYGLMHESNTGKRVHHTKLADIAANHLREIKKVQSKGPYFLGGFCFGGVVAFEIAQQLQKQGQEVALLFLVDLGVLKNWRFRFKETDCFPTKVRQKITRHGRSLARLDAREKYQYVQVRVAATIRQKINRTIAQGIKIVATITRNAYFITGRPLPPRLRQRYLLSVDQWAMRHYEPGIYTGDLILYKSAQNSYDPAWIIEFITGKLHLYELPCSHSDLLKKPGIELWAKELRVLLEKAQSDH